MTLWVLIVAVLWGHGASCSAQRHVCGQIVKRKVTCENMRQCLSRPRVWDAWNFPGIVNEEKINKCPCSGGQWGESRCLTGQKCPVSSGLVSSVCCDSASWRGLLASTLLASFLGKFLPRKKNDFHLFLRLFFLFRNAAWHRSRAGNTFYSREQ